MREYINENFIHPLLRNCPADIDYAVEYAFKEDESKNFVKGVAERLTQLGVECSPENTELMLKEIKKRFKNMLNKQCSKAIENWIRGGNTSTVNRLNNYDLCLALEMNLNETAAFFKKYFLTLPFNCKNRIDAVFLYCLYHNRPYSVASFLIDKSKDFEVQEYAHTKSSQIYKSITDAKSDDEFLKYLSTHCYGEKQQFQLARNIIENEIKEIKRKLQFDDNGKPLTEKQKQRLNNRALTEILGFNYQVRTERNNRKEKVNLPKRFTESLPNDTTLGQILNGEKATYDTVRKTLILVKFNTFYHDCINETLDDIISNINDFTNETDSVLISCGFSQLYDKHPFDLLILCCANTYDPIDSLWSLNDTGD